MAAERPLAERGFVEIKMGRSKFPGKPCKIGNRKRVNLSSCALPEDNDSSKAAKNIYLGLSVFNETFGDNEMIAPGPFHGFSQSEVEEAIAEARLQHNEAELEVKKQGLNVNFWESFQKELFSVMGCSSYGCSNNQEIKKTKLSFDGGGGNKSSTQKQLTNPKGTAIDEQPTIATRSVSKGHKNFKTCKLRNSTPEKKIKVVKFLSPKVKLMRLQCSHSPRKSLQSQAAKRLLDKAKMSNLFESNKNNSTEKKFIFPTCSIHSSRVIKTNKRYLDDSTSKRNLLRNRTLHGASDNKKPKVLKSSEPVREEKQAEESKADIRTNESKKKSSKTDCGCESKNCECDRGSSHLSGNGEVILREARLQLDNSNVTLLEGPFSSPSASGLNSNSHLKMNLIRAATSESIKCGVCGVVGIYKFVGTSKKFGIYCCESCQKFISKIIKSCDSEKNSSIECVRGKGLCGIVSFPKSRPLDGKKLKESRCPACWLKLCLKNFKMPIKLKQKLVKLLPVNLQLGINLSLLLPSDPRSKFMLGHNNVKDFNWLNENFKNSNDVKFNDKQSNWTSALESNVTEENYSRKRIRTGGIENKPVKPTEKIKSKADEKNRQSVVLKGPRVKHVCRSASVVLGQPLAIFPIETSPTKKETNEADENCQNCDSLLTTNVNTESQEMEEKPSDELGQTENVENNPKEVSSSKIANQAQQSAPNKSKKKTNVKAENPISMDFWECYDPDEVCETGFGLIGSESFSVRALCFLCGSSGQEKLIHCASCCEPYHEFCVNEGQQKLQDGSWKYDWVCPRCTVCFTCGKTSGQQLKCIKCDNSYHTECVDRVGGRLLYSPDRPWVCSVCLRCKSCNGVDVSVFVGNLPLCKACFVLRQKGNYCPLCQRCYEDDDYDSKMMECGQCKCWVHAKCEGLSDEKYQVLSFLPESVEYICRMCCVMPPAPWWIAVEAELKSGYLGVLKALSKNRKACAMLKWSPRKQCTCRQVRSVSRTLDLDDLKTIKSTNENKVDNSSVRMKENNIGSDKGKDEKYQPGVITERKTSIEVINHPTESLKLTLKILKGAEGDDKDSSAFVDETSRVNKYNDKESTLRVKKCLSTEDSSEDSLTNTFDCPEDSQISLNSLFKGNDFGASSEFPDKRSLSSPLNPPSDSGIGSTDDELKASCLTDEEGCRLDEQQQKSSSTVAKKPNCDTLVAFLEEKRECFCFLEVDSYNSRSKPFSPNLMSIKKKVTTSEYTSLHQFHEDMQGMIATTQSAELMDLYHQTIKEIFPWFDPKYSRVQSNSQKVSGTASVESTPTKRTPTKDCVSEECKVPKEKLSGQALDYFYGGHVIEDSRVCVMCKIVGDGPPEDTGRLLYCGQNEWVHCNCALWSGEVFEEIDGSLQNVHSAINRGRSIRCPECNLKGASIGCCARNCQETYHFKCARTIGCIFMDDKTVYCPSHVKESIGKLVQNEKELEVRRPVYVELDKRRMKTVDSSQIRFIVGALQVNALGKFVLKLSDQPEAIIPEQFHCTRWFWSCYEPWRIVRYHFTVRLLEVEDDEGIDCGVNLTIDHSVEPELLELKLKQLKYFQDHNAFLEINEKLIEERLREKRNLAEAKAADEIKRNKSEEGGKATPVKISKKDHKVMKKIVEHFDSRDEENCLVDNHNTADLLPPDLEEAIFKDLPHDILDGISMQDIFMDIKADAYENNAKECMPEDEDISENIYPKPKKQDYQVESVNQVELWMDGNEARHESGDDCFSKSPREAKKSKIDGISQIKKVPTLRTYQKSCGFNWNVKSDGSCNKLKKSPKCHVTVNLFESQERNSLLQELKFPDDLVSVTTGPIDSIKDLKSRLEDTKCSIQQEEGKENKCLPWHACLQPRLLQVDGNVDSSSSSSEAGESPQRLVDDTNSKIVHPPQVSPFLDSPLYSNNSPMYPGLDSDASEPKKSFPSFSVNYYYENSPSSNFTENNLPQLDGVSDFYNDGSDLDDLFFRETLRNKRPKKETKKKNKSDFKHTVWKINQCDGGVDSESDGNEGVKSIVDDLPSPLRTSLTKDEPVKCKQCHCTYRTKISYQRHLDMCCSDFILSSSEGEASDDESPKKPLNNVNGSLKPKTDNGFLSQIEMEVEKKQEDTTGFFPSEVASLDARSPDLEEKLEVKKKVIKRTYTRKRPTQINKKVPTTNNINGVQQMQQVLVQQPNTGPTLLVQDLPRPNIVPTAYAEPSHTIGYVTPIESQNPFTKPQLIAVPNGMISGNFSFSTTPEAPVIGGLCLNTQQIQANIPGFIIQHPQSTPIITPQSGSFMMSGEQMMLGPTFPAGTVIQDPGTGGMFIANHNQPVFYNMETVVSNNVMQTNQFVSNVIASSFTQTSTHIFQTHETEHVVNLPTNYLVLGPSPSPTNKILPPEGLICIQTPQTLISNQTPIQISNQPILGSSFQPPQTVNSESKLPTQISSVRLPQLHMRTPCPSIVVNKITNGNTQMVNQAVAQVFPGSKPSPRMTVQNALVKPKQITTTLASSNQFRSMPMMRPNVSKSSPKGYEKAVITPKLKYQHIQPRSRGLVDYINNFRPDAADSYLTKESSLGIAKTEFETENNKSEHFMPVCVGQVTSNSVQPPSLPKFEEKPPSYTFNPANGFEVTKTSAAPLPVESRTKASPIKKNTEDSAHTACHTDIVSPRQTPDPGLVALKNEPPETLPVSRDSGSEKKKIEKIEVPVQNSPPKVLTNMTNSISFCRESKLNMPLLEDSLPEQIKPTNESQPGEVLPLQDSAQAYSTDCLMNCKSPQQSSPVKIKSPVSDERVKKKKALSFDQNLLDVLSLAGNQGKEETGKKRQFYSKKKAEEKGPKLIFDVISDDGFKSSSTSMVELWANICDSVQEMRAVLKIPPLPMSKKGSEILGMQNHGLQHCLEQLKGVEQCVKYKCKYFVREEPRKGEDEEDEKENLSGCARTEQFTTRKEYDMFAWLASRHRQLPKLTESAEEILSSIRRANSLPMAMRYRNLKETSKLYLGVYRSKIHGRGLFCLREIEAGEMVIEYAGEVIRSNLTDKREKYYTEKGIGCYMFRIDDHFVVDATMKGNAARFINHSCEPNCYSRVVDVLGKKHIVIFALRRISIMEELTYDYKFPFEDEKISCHCLSKKCRKYLN